MRLFPALRRATPPSAPLAVMEPRAGTVRIWADGQILRLSIADAAALRDMIGAALALPAQAAGMVAEGAAIIPEGSAS